MSAEGDNVDTCHALVQHVVVENNKDEEAIKGEKDVMCHTDISRQLGDLEMASYFNRIRSLRNDYVTTGDTLARQTNY